MAKQAVGMLVALAAMVVVAASAGGALAVQCNPSHLAVCAPAIINGKPPTAECCSNLREQESCFCKYAHNPAYKKYIDSPNARRTLSACGIPIPICPDVSASRGSC